jgi:hypothetical protein
METVVLPTLSKVAVNVPPLLATLLAETEAMLELLTVMLYAGEPPLMLKLKTSPTLAVDALGSTATGVVTLVVPPLAGS